MSTPLNPLVDKIRKAHPGAYDDIDDATLTNKVLAKYPQYSDLAAPPAAGPGKSMRTGEGPIARNMTSFEAQLSQMPKAAVKLLLAKHWPIVDSRNYHELWEDIKSLNPVMREYEGGPVDYGATAANVLPLLVGDDENGSGGIKESPAGKMVKGGLSKVGQLRKDAAERVRTATQRVAGAGPERTTEPMVEEYKAKSAEAKAKQADANRDADVANRKKIEDYQTGKRSALQKTEEQNAEHALSKEETAAANAQEQARVKEINDAAQGQQGRRSELATTIKRGSRELGEGIKQKVSEVRAQDNANYAEVKAKLAKDPGVPMADIAKEARVAEGMLKGSSENIKQFRELIRKAPESEGVETSAGFVQPGDPLYEQLQREGAIDTGGNLPFDQLQGYSSEIGMKLARGGLPGDTYQALKYLKGKIDAAKTTVAERNGVGAELKAADAFHYNFMDTFYDKPSAVAATLDRVGKLDPEFYAEPFTTGKAGQTGIGKLQRYDPKLADLATSLRKSHEEFTSIPKQPKTATPKLKAEPDFPSPIEPPKKPELQAPKKIEQPSAPTVDDVRARKTKEIKTEAREIGRFNRWDAGIIASSAVAPFLGHWEGLLIDPAYLVARKSIGRILDRPAVQKWLAEPSAEDLRILNSLPSDAKATVQSNMKNFIAQNPGSTLAPAVKGFLAGGAVGNQVAKTPGEARERMRKYAPITDQP